MTDEVADGREHGVTRRDAGRIEIAAVVVGLEKAAGGRVVAEELPQRAPHDAESLARRQVGTHAFGEVALRLR